ncbi:hypothetical protein [Breznakiella homolactica]|uniref:Uncharacterized protein n=1 Tax=Breznakiella homolactica TaxID=2798577 RepID=A0A7T7XJN0_9SPIR|nr:hypothetical protein [Breznakiella homolactica]QQO07644.1 hypothetical protein JFL75_11870 [Breznakiella homolactica]
MGADHGETVLQKPISEYAQYIKNLIPANIPGTYALKPMFENIAGEEKIRDGIAAFRDFLYVFCDRLISDGHAYAKPQRTKNPANYPFLHDLNYLLIDIGYHGKLAGDGGSISVADIPSFADPKPKLSAPKQTECLRFLRLCGFAFTGIDLEKKARIISQVLPAEVSYPANPILLTGLKALSIAAKELWVRFYNTADNLFRCDYRVLKAEDTDVFDVLKDFLHPLPKKIQTFALELHRRYTDRGMTCVTLNDEAVHFAYSYTKNSRRTLSTRDIYQQRIWEFALSMQYGYCLVVRSKRIDKHPDVIKGFPLPLQERIARGYGCDRKLYNAPCQGGCQGIRIPLDDSILPISRDIETWLDHETPGSSGK